MFNCFPCGPTCVLPPVIHPMQNCVEHVFSTTIVPNVFPSHETIVQHSLIQPENFFPHSTSFVSNVQPLPAVNHPPMFMGGYPGVGPGFPGAGPVGPMPFGGAPGMGGMPMGGMPGAMPMGGIPGTMPMM